MIDTSTDLKVGDRVREKRYYPKQHCYENGKIVESGKTEHGSIWFTVQWEDIEGVNCSGIYYAENKELELKET